MTINTYHLVEGAKRAEGLTVIIDVFRAFTVEPYIIAGGAEKLYPVGNLDIAYDMKKQNPEILLVGERNEQKPEGFDFGNSPGQVQSFDFTGKTVVHTTSAGTQGIANAQNADEIITGSFVNAPAIVRYIQKQQPKIVSLVCMGYAAKHPTEEDTLCAEYIESVLVNKPFDYPSMVDTLRKTSGKRFFIPEKQTYAPENDFHLCTQLGIFDFILRIEKNNTGPNAVIKINC